jgi:hypothetical protein
MTLLFLPSDGFGNLLFQHHAAYAFAREHKLELYALGWYYDIRPKFGEYAKLFKHVKIIGNVSDCEPINDYFQDPQRWRINKALNYFQGRIHIEPGHTYSPIPPDARILSGYFQSWKYFDKFRIEIRDLLFSNEPELYSLKKEKHATLSEGKPTVCVHIRRGDYAKNPNIHPMCNQEYYTKSINDFKGHYKFLIFAEDIEEIRKWNVWSDRDVHFLDDEPLPLETLFLMALCNNFIIANSSLSLMAYYMRQNEDARLIFPKDWFGPGGPRFNIEDIVK